MTDTAPQGMTVEEYLASFDPSTLTSGGTLAPIGVPDVQMTGGQPVPFEANGVAPRYFEGDDWGPAAMTREDRARLQRLMAAAGIIPKGAEYRLGVWDDVSRAAYRSVLAQANASGMSPKQVIGEWANAEVENKPAPQPYLAPDPASLRSDVKSLFESRIGRKVTDDELPTLVGEALALDRQGYDTSVANAQAGSGQQFDAGARFEDYLETRYRPEIERREGMLDMAQQREGLMANVFALDQYVGQ